MDAWARFERACLAWHGVGDVDLARTHGITANRFYERTAREQWGRPLPGIRLHPEAAPSVQQRLVVVCRTSRDVAGASGEAGAWLHGLRPRPPQRSSVLVRHATRCRAHGGVLVRRARWLEPDDVTELDGVPTLGVPALLVSLLDTPPRDQLARLLDAVQRGLTTPDDVLDRLSRIGPVPGKAVLRAHCERAARHRIESVFQAEVATDLARRGYRPERSTRRIDTPDGIGLVIDVPLVDWQVAVEPDGDAYHRTREHRRRDRRREAAFAATDWVRVPVDWRDWELERERVFRTIDDAIEAQRRRGIGASIPPPRRGRASG